VNEACLAEGSPQRNESSGATQREGSDGFLSVGSCWRATIAAEPELPTGNLHASPPRQPCFVLDDVPLPVVKSLAGLSYAGFIPFADLTQKLAPSRRVTSEASIQGEVQVVPDG